MTGTAVVPSKHTRLILTLSEGTELEREHAKVATFIEHELARADRYRALGRGLLARIVLDDLFDYIMGAPRLTESELRLLDGNR